MIGVRPSNGWGMCCIIPVSFKESKRKQYEWRKNIYTKPDIGHGVVMSIRLEVVDRLRSGPEAVWSVFSGQTVSLSSGDGDEVDDPVRGAESVFHGGRNHQGYSLLGRAMAC